MVNPSLRTRIGDMYYSNELAILTIVFKQYTRRYAVPPEVFYPMYYSSNPGKYYNQFIKKQFKQV